MTVGRLSWREWVLSRPVDFQLPPPSSPAWSFELGVSTITAADGSSREVDTLEHVLKSLDRTSAPGLSGLDFNLLRNVDPDALRPLLKIYYGHGRWDYSLQHHKDTHDVLVSNRGAALDKVGEGRAADCRPLGVGDARRRVALKCYVCQEGPSIGRKLAARGQYGCGLKNGTELVYHQTTKVLEALYARNIPVGTSEGKCFSTVHGVARGARGGCDAEGGAAVCARGPPCGR